MLEIAFHISQACPCSDMLSQCIFTTLCRLLCRLLCCFVADEAITATYTVVEILSEEQVIEQTKLLELVLTDDLNGIINAFKSPSDVTDINRPDFIGRSLLGTAVRYVMARGSHDPPKTCFLC